MGNHSGFTLIEVLVAVFLMAVGFLAMSQMQYLSFRQSQSAENGTIATNIIQAVSERDISSIRNTHRLNLNYLENPNNSASEEFCRGSNNQCSNFCPCDPFRTILDNPATAGTEPKCAPIVLESFNPDGIIYLKDRNSCSALSAGQPIDYYIIKNIEKIINVNIRTYRISYAVMTAAQFNDPDYVANGFDSTNGFDIDLRNNLAAQRLEITAEIQGRNVIPNLP